ncbi:hypothetical protein OIU34_21085 [Pararhizobium sp. BT-229]|uniref:hypothetical protein n=1 Tax=Pararhizobium sp. BT-229 TaxID=2986923 RepID=UPI0021F713A0|nr:hypothetical protein [Pararhizobium sp. BT-229]MCV9964386.1 hypothetical protein [Pararhizobium sp. BT-229]
MTVERRRALVERIVAQSAQRGQPIDDDPKFMAWVEEWVAGEIDVPELRRRYGELLKARHEERRERRAAYLASFARPATAKEAEQSEPPSEPEFVNSLEAVLLGLHKERDQDDERTETQ